ncbi:aminodeoxychorismate synthase component I [Sphingomonas sp.]
MTPDPPFVLLDDARPDGGTGRLYRDPVAIVRALDADDVVRGLDEIRRAGRDGLHAAGFLAYGAGRAFEAKAPASPHDPLMWFGLFEGYAPFDPATLPDPAGAWTGAAEPLIARGEHAAQVEQVKALIEAGDLYQANLTFAATARIAGSPMAVYARLRAASMAGWGAVVATGESHYLSLSPELFFALDAGRLTARPMKGTAMRHGEAAEDEAAARALAEDPKQRAENLMIVDLMRNDLSRVARPGSVAVPALFEVERYPTVQQMTSTVTARLAEGRDACDVIAALFPCGSITGAPKLRAMQAIGEIEPQPRGIYTGAIGHVAPGGNAQFNVAIRTLTVRADDDRATLGLGSGIVADSRADDEWEECMAKGAFLTRAGRSFDLIETMRFEPREGVLRLERHLERMKRSALFFGIPFDRHAVRNELQVASFRLDRAVRLRLALSPRGTTAIEIRPLTPVPDTPVPVAIAPLPVEPDDFRLRHKTSDRAFYDEARRAAGAFEVVFTDSEGFVTEGSFTNVFVDRGDGVFWTPPAARGLLPGVLRAEWLESGRAVERDLAPDDLKRGFIVANALRGAITARLVAQSGDAPL